MEYPHRKISLHSWLRLAIIAITVSHSTGYLRHAWNKPIKSSPRQLQLQVATTINEVKSSALYRDGMTVKKSSISKKLSQNQQDDLQYSKAELNTKFSSRELRTVSARPLLTHEEEISLGYKIQRLIELEQLREELFINSGEKPTLQQWSDAFSGSPEDFQRRIMEGREARDEMVNRNMRLVVSIAKRYQDLGVNFHDLIQEGSIGLVKAAERFDPRRGFRFSTYASWWIQQSLSRCIAFHSRTIRLPTHAHNLLNRARSIRQKILMDTGKTPTDIEVASEIDIPVDKLRFLMRSTRHVHSSNAPITKRGGSAIGKSEVTFEETTPADNKMPEEIVEKSMLMHEINDVLDLLDQDERLVICLRYGLCGVAKSSVAQISNLAGTSQSWVKSMEARALRKLRLPHQQFKLRHFTAADAPEVYFSDVVKKDYENTTMNVYNRRS